MVEPPTEHPIEHVKLSTITAALFCLLFGTLVKAEPYQVVTEEWAPYNYLENQQLTGMATDIVRAIMALTGDDFEVLVLPSMRATLALQNRPKTIMYSLFRTRQREPLYKWVGPIVEESIFPYQLAQGRPPVYSMEQLQRVAKITTRHAGLVPERMLALGFSNLDRSANQSRQLYRMLLAGRTDVIVGDTPAGVEYYSRELNIAPGVLRQIPVEIHRSALYIAFSRDSDDTLVAAWASALEQLRQSGELQRIRQRYERPAVQ
ncbi:substrate-binding periplasmic protein [Pseudomonas sp. TE3786]